MERFCTPMRSSGCLLSASAIGSPRQLLIGTIVLLSFATAWSVKDYFHEKNAFDLATAAQQKKEQGKALTKKEESAIADWQSVVHEKKPSKEKLNEEIEAYHQDYFSILVYKGPLNLIHGDHFLLPDCLL